MRKKTAQRPAIIISSFLLIVILQFAFASPGAVAHSGAAGGSESILSPANQNAALAGPVVDTLDDEDDGSCTGGDCSLREAIADASSGDTITFDVSGTITLSLGELVIGKNLIIDGGGSITVDGNNAVRVFNVTNGNVTFDDLTIENGKFKGAVLKCGIASDKGGGGILNDGASVTVKNSTLANNTADCGGAILNDGTLTVEKSTFDNNTADVGIGGAIDNRSGKTTTITDSTLSNNTAAQNGGAINNYGTVNVTRSTLNGNEAADWGGGIYNQGAVNVNNSTFSDNLASEGGGLLSYCNGGDVAVNNSTFTANRAKSTGGGGGIVSGGDGCTSNKSTLSNTIVSANVKDGTAVADDLALLFGTSSSFDSDGYNLIGTMGSGITFAGTGDQTNKNDPKLDSLANNGGDAKTHALQTDSLAVDNGNCSGGPATDQRGVARPQNANCDVGAYELIKSPTADFSGTPTSGTKPLEVDFSDASTGDINSRSWDFGDGNSSTQSNPSHTYTTAGDYTVALTVSGPGGDDTETKTNYISVADPGQPPVADFSGSPTSGLAPLQVDFTNQSIGTIGTHVWNFGDGQYSQQINPSHTYKNPGVYNVSLTVYGHWGNDTKTKTDYIHVEKPPTPCSVEVTNSQSSGPGSLRDALAKVCERGRITFDRGLANSTIDISPDGELLIDKSLIIDGNGYCNIDVSGNDKVRVFNVKSGNVTMACLGITRGLATTNDCPNAYGPGSAGICGGGILVQSGANLRLLSSIRLTGNSADFGGAIASSGALRVRYSTLSRNSAAYSGGGIYNEGGSVTVSFSTIKNNTAKHGGAIATQGGSLSVDNTSFLTNFASEDGGAIRTKIRYISPEVSGFTMSHSYFSDNVAQKSGGAIFQEGGSMTVKDSTINGNRANQGGAIFKADSGALFNSQVGTTADSLTVSNTTISGNSVDEFGAGLFNESGSLIVNNSTVTNNLAGVSGGGITSYGTGAASTTISNTIVAGNVISSTTTADDLALHGGSTNSFHSAGYNLIGIMGPDITFDGTGDLTNVADPKLGPLADNGGDTLTHALLPGSPAIDAGGDCDEPFDQRGVKRPQGPACDIGGYELIFDGEYQIALPVIIGYPGQ